MRIRLAFLTVVLGMQCALAAGAAPDRFADAQRAVDRSIERGQVPSIAWAVIQEGRVVWSGGAGSAQIAENVAATADTPYILASVSKPITATGLMILVENGQVSLDKPVNTYLEDCEVKAYVGSADDMTVRRLANHTSGMPTHWNFFYAPNSPPPMAENINRYAFAAWEPGTRYNYSNLAFGMLNHVTETVSGQAWGAFMEERLYDPAGMLHTSDRVRPGLENIAAHSYSQDAAGRWTLVTPYAFDHPGASAIWSSAHDLARFLLLHMHGGELDGRRILQAETVAEMQRVHPDAKGAGSNTGVSWGIYNENGLRRISHGGGMPGVLTQLVAFPELQAGYVILTNGDGHGAIGSLQRAIREVILPESESAESETGRSEEDQPAPDIGGTWEGRIEDAGEPVLVELEFREENVARARLGGPENTRKRTEYRQTQQRVGFQLADRWGSYSHFHGTPQLRFELELVDGVMRGVMYVDAPSCFRLPHYVELRPAAD